MNKASGKSVVLIGFMGSGKSTLGIRLSYRLQYALEDTDKLIECRVGRTIGEIFDQEGEEAFRQMETEQLRKLVENKGQRFYSVGGGTPIREVNRSLLKQLGFVVYLRISPEAVYERLKGDTTRPLLQGKDPLGRIRSLMAEREAAYTEAADVILDVDDLTADQVVEQIVSYVR